MDFSEFLGIFSLYLGIRNLTENEQQSEQQLKILRQNDVGAANDRQAAYLLEELGRKFDEQNKILAEILREVKHSENHQRDCHEHQG